MGVKKVKPVEWAIAGFRGYKTETPKKRRPRQAPSSGDCQDCIGMYGQTGVCYCDQVNLQVK